MKIATRIREWAADHFSFVQYPNVRGPKPWGFKFQMPWYERMALAVLSSIVIVVCLVVLAFMLFIVYSVLK